MVGEVSVHVFETVMPIQQDVAFIHPFNSKPYELSYVIKVSLACGNVPRIDINFLKLSEEKFTRSHIITMRPQQH